MGTPVREYSANYLTLQPQAIQTQFLDSLTEDELYQLNYDWRFWARDKQLPPLGDWYTWLIMAGRGWGKTRTGAEYVLELVRQGNRRIALVARTAADVRDVMVEGESGILNCAPPWNRPLYEPSKRRLTWPNGAIATTYSGDKPDQLRGPQHDGAWADELAAWRYAESWDQLLFGLRLGDDPRVVVTTTPRPVSHIIDLTKAPDTYLTVGTTYENIANLAPQAVKKLKAKYEGTRLGRQELLAVLLDDNPGALWRRHFIDDYRVMQYPDLNRLVVGVDPAASTSEDASDTGIVVAGIGDDGHGYVLEDVTLKGTPDEWGRAAVTAYHKFNAGVVVAEDNHGGDMVEHVIRTVDSRVAYHNVHASRGKKTRAQPVAALYEQGKVHHVGMFAELEDQMCQWEPGMNSPDRLDALVWSLTKLMLEGPDEISEDNAPDLLMNWRGG